MTRAGLTFRDALDDQADIGSVVQVEGSDRTPPFVTIAITTYKRPDLLRESVRSALDQDFDRPVEIAVFDNDPESTGAAALLEHMPELATRNFRYIVNSGNLGVFGNFNRCITTAHAPWLTILQDDDLLDPAYLQQMFDEIDAHPTTDGIVCLKRFFGGKDEGDATPPAPPMSRAVLLGSLRSRTGLRALAGRVTGRLLAEGTYRGRRSRRIAPRKFFWGAVLGNGSGFLFRIDAARKVGGFYAEEYPSADIWFFARLAKTGHLRQHRAIAASIRKTEGNITVRTITEQLAEGRRLYATLAGTEAPRWWARTIPMMIARDRAEYMRVWNADVPAAEVERALGIRLPPDRPRLHAALRILMGGQ